MRSGTIFLGFFNCHSTFVTDSLMSWSDRTWHVFFTESFTVLTLPSDSSTLSTSFKQTSWRFYVDSIFFFFFSLSFFTDSNFLLPLRWYLYHEWTLHQRTDTTIRRGYRNLKFMLCNYNWEILYFFKLRLNFFNVRRNLVRVRCDWRGLQPAESEFLVERVAVHSVWLNLIYPCPWI